jgi:hypothetical protein
MKKMFLFLFIPLLLFVIMIYLFIPAKIEITESVLVNTTDNGTGRFLLDEGQWAQWWNYSSADSTAKPLPATTSFTLNGDVYKITKQFYKSIDIQILHKSQVFESKLVIIPLTLDSTGIEWKCSLLSGYNPYSRLTHYAEARQIKSNMSLVLKSLRRFLAKNENIYGISIEKTTLKDTLFVSAKKITPVYPSLKEVYELIKKIQLHIAGKNTKQSGSPIYNITQLSDGQYQLMAAIPVDKRIEDAAGFALKFMVRGSFMVTEVTGGEYTVNKASKSLQQYFADFRKTSMAMNFTMLVTDRQYQPDSTKWITKLYQPVY